MSAAPTVQEVTGATEFTGIADAGLFTYTVPRGRVLVLDVYVQLGGSAATVSVYFQDPDNVSNKILRLQSSGAVNTYSAENLEVPTAADGTAWNVLVETSGKSATGYATFVPSSAQRKA